MAVGKITKPDELSDELKQRELSPRTRKELNELMIPGLSWKILSQNGFFLPKLFLTHLGDQIVIGKQNQQLYFF